MKKILLFVSLSVFLAFIAGCAPSGTTTPSTSNQTQKPELITVNDGVRILYSGDSIRDGITVTFTGSGPANAIIKVYLNGTLFDSTTTDDAGSFTWTWTSGTTEGTFTFGFTAEAGELPESTQDQFQIVVDITPPYLGSSCSAKADTLLGSAPTITVQFNEPVTVGDINLFETPAFWNVGCTVCPGGSVFTVTQVTLGADNQTVTLTGNWTTDFLVAGDQIMVVFTYNPLMDIKDAAGNQFNTVASLPTCMVTP